MNHRRTIPKALIALLPLLITIFACASTNSTVVLPTLTLPTSLPPTQSESAVEAPTDSNTTPPTNGPGLQTNDTLLVDLYKRVSPGVVAITIYTTDLGIGQGSGFIIDSAGYIVTNNHVVEDAEQIEITFSDGYKVYADLIGTDSTADLAVLKVDAPSENLTVLSLGDSDAIQVGQAVVAIGTPFGYEGTMTTGIISGTGRALVGDSAPTGGNFSSPDVIQTDAAINPGNSGGPLFNLAGEVIGVNRAIVSNTGTNSGVGFSIASNTVKRIVPNLIEFGRHDYAYLGVSGIDTGELSLAQIEAIGLPGFQGAYIVQVVPGEAAAAAGLQGDSNTNGLQLTGGGDFITHVDGVQMNTFEDILSYLVNHTEPGQQIIITIIRNGETIEVPVTLGARP